jgi:hypothetical protein
VLKVSVSRASRVLRKDVERLRPVPGLARIVGLAGSGDADREGLVREWALAMIEQAGHSRDLAPAILQRMLLQGTALKK